MLVHFVTDEPGKIPAIRAMLEPRYDVAPRLLGRDAMQITSNGVLMVDADLRKVVRVEQIKLVLRGLRCVTEKLFVVQTHLQHMVAQAHALGATAVFRNSREIVFKLAEIEAAEKAAKTDFAIASPEVAVGAAAFASMFAAIRNGKSINLSDAESATSEIINGIGCPMATDERIAADISGPLLVLARGTAMAAAIFVLAAFVFSTRARADCLSDVVNAVMNTASALDSPQCQTAFAESSLVTTGLTAAFEADQNLASQVCNAVSDVNSWLPGIPAAIQAELGPLDPIDFATCACSLYQGVGQLPSEAVDCIQGFICGLSQLVGLGNPCQTCQQPPPVPANCTPPDCTNWRNDPSLNSTCSNILEYNTGGPNRGYFPVQETQEPDGSTIIITGIDTGPLTTCNPGQYCVCPSPMTVVNVKEYDPSGDSTWYYATCQCPTAADRNNDPSQGTKPLKPSGPLAYVCICDSTGLPAVPPDWGQPTTPGGNNLNPTHSICPVPLTGVPCPVAGQIRVNNNKCVAPCTKPGEVMTPDGVCCDPNNVAECGQCCGDGMVPNPANGTCMPNRTTQ